MPALDDLQRMIVQDPSIRAVYWCKDHAGFITEHVATPYEGHRGHVQCVPVAVAAAESGRSEQS